MYTFDENLVSDFHKETRNVRPSADWWVTWNASTDSQKQHIWDDLLRDMERDAEWAEQQEALEQQEIELSILAAIQVGAPDRETALRWIS